MPYLSQFLPVVNPPQLKHNPVSGSQSSANPLQRWGSGWEIRSSLPGTGHNGGRPLLHGRVTVPLLGHIWRSVTFEGGSDKLSKTKRNLSGSRG